MSLPLGLLIVVNAFLLWSPRLPLLQQRLLRIVGLYALLAFTLRAIYLIAATPRPRENSNVAIAAIYPDYSARLGPIAELASVGLTVLAATVYAISHTFRRAEQCRNKLVAPVTLLRVYLIASAAKLSLSLAGDSGFVARAESFTQALALGALAMMVINTDWRDAVNNPLLLLALVTSVELAFAILTASKTPLLSVVLIFYLDVSRPRWNLRVLTVVTSLVLVSFTFIQGLKGTGSGDELNSDSIGNSLAFAIVGRLDGLMSLTASQLNGPRSFRPDGGLLFSLVQGFAPDFLIAGEKSLTGLQWGRQMYFTDNGVSYAEGTFAEGYALYGFAGLVVWSIITGILISTSSYLATSPNLFLSWVSASLLSSTALFERGLIGQIENLGAFVQVAVVAVLAYSLLRPGRNLRSSRLGPGNASTAVKKRHDREERMV